MIGTTPAHNVDVTSRSPEVYPPSSTAVSTHPRCCELLVPQCTPFSDLAATYRAQVTFTLKAVPCRLLHALHPLAVPKQLDTLTIMLH
jgi:hypothetical protein